MDALLHGLRRVAPVLGVAALVAGCDDDVLIPVLPDTSSVDPMFNTYVAIGNSITAGVQSGGINAATQEQSYAALLAAQMGTPFNQPLLNAPGCPPPFANIFTQERVVDGVECALRARPIPAVIHNVAVPGADVIDPLSNLAPSSSANTLTTLFLGGRTQLEAAADANPTFLTVWIGNGDALSAITRDDSLTGDPSAVTSVADFTARYGDLVEAIQALDVQGGVLIGAVQVVFAPYLTSGPVWEFFEGQFDATVQSTLDSVFAAVSGGFTLSAIGVQANFLDVTAACSAIQPLPTGDTAFAAVPFPVGGPALSTASARAADSATVDSLFQFAGQVLEVLGGAMIVPDSGLIPAPTVIDCAHPRAITAAEAANLLATVAQYNAVIENAASSLGFVYIDPNDLLAQLQQDTTAIRPFPAFPGTVQDPSISLNAPFGTALSLDGIHPSASAHELVAGALIQAINAAYNTSIPGLPGL